MRFDLHARRRKYWIATGYIVDLSPLTTIRAAYPVGPVLQTETNSLDLTREIHNPLFIFLIGGHVKKFIFPQKS